MEMVISGYLQLSNSFLISPVEQERARGSVLEKRFLYQDRENYILLPIDLAGPHAIVAIIVIEPLFRSECPASVLFGFNIWAIHVCCAFPDLQQIITNKLRVIECFYPHVTIDISRVSVDPARVYYRPGHCSPITYPFAKSISEPPAESPKSLSEPLAEPPKDSSELTPSDYAKKLTARISSSLEDSKAIISRLSEASRNDATEPSPDDSYDDIRRSFLREAEQQGSDGDRAHFLRWFSYLNAGGLDSIAERLPRRKVANDYADDDDDKKQHGQTRKRRRDYARLLHAIAYRYFTLSLTEVRDIRGIYTTTCLIYASLGASNYYFSIRKPLSLTQYDLIAADVVANLRDPVLTAAISRLTGELEQQGVLPHDPVHAISQKTHLRYDEIFEKLLKGNSDELTRATGNTKGPRMVPPVDALPPRARRDTRSRQNVESSTPLRTGDSDSDTSNDQDGSTPATMPSDRPPSYEEPCTRPEATLISSHDGMATCDGSKIGRMGELLAAATLQGTHAPPRDYRSLLICPRGHVTAGTEMTNVDDSQNTTIGTRAEGSDQLPSPAQIPPQIFGPEDGDGQGRGRSASNTRHDMEPSHKRRRQGAVSESTTNGGGIEDDARDYGHFAGSEPLAGSASSTIPNFTTQAPEQDPEASHFSTSPKSYTIPSTTDTLNANAAIRTIETHNRSNDTREPNGQLPLTATQDQQMVGAKQRNGNLAQQGNSNNGMLSSSNNPCLPFMDPGYRSPNLQLPSVTQGPSFIEGLSLDVPSFAEVFGVTSTPPPYFAEVFGVTFTLPP